MMRKSKLAILQTGNITTMVVYILLLFLCGSNQLVQAQSLTGCSTPSGSGLPLAIPLREDQSGQVVCDGLGTDILNWIVNGGGVTDLTTLSTCTSPGPGCTDRISGIATATRANTSSTLTFKNVRRSVEGTMTITCRTTQDATCPIDAFYPAEVSGSGCDVTVNTSGNEWTLQGSCDVTKVFSSRDRYHCQWYQRLQGNSSASPITTVKSANTQVPGTSAKPYYSFTCTFSLALSQLTVGTYDFSVFANPGSTTSTPVTYQIELPRPRHNCGDEATWRKVGDRLTCTCSADVTGTPAALFRWQNTGTSQLDQGLTSVDHGKQLTCRALWGSDVKASVTYTPKVAYGPNNVTVTGPSTPFDTNGQMAMTLNCAPVAFNPSPVNLQWRHLPATNVIGTQSSLPLTPAVSDDGTQVQCTATNTQFASLNASGNYTIVLNWFLCWVPGPRMLKKSTSSVWSCLVCTAL